MVREPIFAKEKLAFPSLLTAGCRLSGFLCDFREFSPILVRDGSISQILGYFSPFWRILDGSS
jgi:hypothetical protein